MKIKDIALSAAYVGQRVVKAICVGAQEVWSAVKYIVFKDPMVEQICATNWGDGVGITEEQAAAVTSIGTKFSRNTEIESFDELKKFTNIKSTPKDSFYTCTNLRTISIPSSVTDILWSSFNGCTKLVNVDIPDDSQIKIIDQWAFNGCSMLKGLNIPQGVTTIRSEAFKGCSSLDMTLPSDLTTIGTSAFANCGITEAVIPSGVESIGMSAFTGCQSLKTVTIQEGTLRTGFDSFYNCQALITVYIPSSLDTLGESTFNYNINLRTVTFADNSQLTTISARVFLECYSLTSITIPNNVNNIGDRAFLSCSQLKNVIMMPIAPPTLGVSVFAGTPSDMSIYVPDQSVTAYREASGWLDYADRIWPMEAYLYGIITFADPAVEAICVANWDTNGSGYLNKEEAKAVTSLGTVFKGNKEITSLNELKYFTNLKAIGYYSLQNCTSLAEITFPTSLTKCDIGSFAGCTALKTIHINSIEQWLSIDFSLDGGTPLYYGGTLYIDNNPLVEIIVPNTITTIKPGAFYYYKAFTKVVLHDWVTSIGPAAFMGCSSLTSINIPNSVTTLGNSAFMNSGIETFVCPSSVTVIEVTLCRYAKKLKFVDLPNTITQIKDYAFANTTVIESFICRAVTPPALGASVFFEVNPTIYVPDASVDAYKAKEGWSTYADRIKPLSQYVEPTNE